MRYSHMYQKIQLKRLSIGLYFICFVLIPFSVLAMDPISDEDLEGVTGTSGVNIKLEGELQIDVVMTKMGWGDADGTTADPNPCFFLLEATSDHPSKTYASFLLTDAEFQIDIGTTTSQPLMVNGKQAVGANSTFIRIDLPTIQSTIVPCKYTNLKLTENPGGTGGNSFGYVETNQFKFLLSKTPSAIYISGD